MILSEKTTINASSEHVWNHLRTLQDAEKYLPVVTKSEVKGSGLGTTRTCDIEMGEKSFQLMETMVKFDDSQKSLSISIDNAPPPMKDLMIDFSVLWLRMKDKKFLGVFSMPPALYRSSSICQYKNSE